MLFHVALRGYVTLLFYVIALCYCVILLRDVITLFYVSPTYPPTIPPTHPTHPPTAIPRLAHKLLYIRDNGVMRKLNAQELFYAQIQLYIAFT